MQTILISLTASQRKMRGMHKPLPNILWLKILIKARLSPATLKIVEFVNVNVSLIVLVAS